MVQQDLACCVVCMKEPAGLVVKGWLYRQLVPDACTSIPVLPSVWVDRVGVAACSHTGVYWDRATVVQQDPTCC
jgi:hypothetical protein